MKQKKIRNQDKIIYNISKESQKAIDKFTNNMISNGDDNFDTIQSYIQSIRRILSMLKVEFKDLKKVSLTDLDNVFSKINPGTRELVKIKFRCFLKFYGFNELANHIKINSKYFKEIKKTANDVLTKDEINKILNSKLSIRDKAVFELFLTTGMRRGEFINLKYQNIEITKDEIIVRITESKTAKRNISIIPYPDNPIAFYPRNFVSYYDQHIFKGEGDKSKPLFFSTSSNSKQGKLNPISLTLFFRKVQSISNVNKKITPHIIRHTSATYDGYHLTTGELELKYGWKPGSDSPKMYCHLNEINFNEHLKRKAGLTTDIVDKECKCPYCHTVNNINAIKCISCQRIINRDELVKLDQERENKENALNKRIKDLEDQLKCFDRSFKDLSDPKGEFTKNVINNILNEIQNKDFRNKIERGYTEYMKDVTKMSNKDKMKMANEWLKTGKIPNRLNEIMKEDLKNVKVKKLKDE